MKGLRLGVKHSVNNRFGRISRLTIQQNEATNGMPIWGTAGWCAGHGTAFNFPLKIREKPELWLKWWDFVTSQEYMYIHV